MSCCNRCNCTLLAVIASVIVGVVAAFLQITGTIIVTTAFLWVLFGIGVVSLGVLLLGAARSRTDATYCLCTTVNTLLVAILGTILFAVVLLAVGVVATSVASAILVGLLLAFFTLLLTSGACLVRYLYGCGS